MGGDRRGIYSIGAVAKMLGVPAQTLRTWEDRYGQIVPERSPGGQRLYSLDQVDQLQFVVEQLERGMAPADAHRLLVERAHLAAGQHASLAAPHTVLLAERDRYAADFASYLLRTEGYATRIALTASAAREILDEGVSSLAVIDLLISGGAGGELSRHAHERRGIPVVAVSALDSRDEALAAGAAVFLLKPVESLRLLSTVRDLLGTSAYLRQRGVVR
jgi:DNA-binding transcriptional MerR regulator